MLDPTVTCWLAQDQEPPPGRAAFWCWPTANSAAKELGYASDLDIVFVRRRRPEAAENYARLGQRTNTIVDADAGRPALRPTCACAPTATPA